MTIQNTTEIHVRFSEVDSLGILWHGHYARYFEDGREAFGRQYKLGYMDVYHQGFTIPIVSMDFQFKNPIIYGNRIRIETTFVNSPAAKIQFNYRLLDPESQVVYGTGSSTQVFMKAGSLYITTPSFFAEWKQLHGLP